MQSFYSVEGNLAWLEKSQVSAKNLENKGLNRREVPVTRLVEAVLMGTEADRVGHRRSGESEVRCLATNSEAVVTTWTQGEELDARSTRQ